MIEIKKEHGRQLVITIMMITMTMITTTTTMMMMMTIMKSFEDNEIKNDGLLSIAMTLKI